MVADIKNAGVDKPVGTELFFSYRLYALSTFHVVIKTTGDPMNTVGAARKVVASLDSTLPLAKVRTVEDVVAAATTRPRFLTLTLEMFSLLALCLAAIGIYGVISYSVEQRTSEFAIKMALGAQPQRVLRQVIGQGLILSLLGVAVGLAGSFLLNRFLEAHAVWNFKVGRIGLAHHNVCVDTNFSVSFFPSCFAGDAGKTREGVAL